MSHKDDELIRQVVDYILDTEAEDFEENIEESGQNHIYYTAYKLAFGDRAAYERYRNALADHKKNWD